MTNNETPADIDYANRSSRFDLEDAIMMCWHTCDDLDLLITTILDTAINADNAAPSDRLANALIGLKELHHLRAEKLFDIFSTLVENREFKSG